MLNKVCVQLTQEREREIVQQSKHGTQQRNELTSYRNSVENISSMLKKNTAYRESEPFQRICQDMQEYFRLVL